MCTSVYLQMYRDTCKRIGEKIAFASETGVCLRKPRCVGSVHLHCCPDLSKAEGMSIIT